MSIPSQLFEERSFGRWENLLVQVLVIGSEEVLRHFLTQDDLQMEVKGAKLAHRLLVGKGIVVQSVKLRGHEIRAFICQEGVGVSVRDRPCGQEAPELELAVILHVLNGASSALAECA